jgi:dTDP-4-dehydrorhamnose reductase
MKILLIGANGQLGSDLIKVLNPNTTIPLTHAEIEISDFNQVKEVLERHCPDMVVNTAAYHRVDECEDNVERSFNVNAYGARNLATVCKDIDAALVHFSTDYVFDGLKNTPYKEDDTPRPLCVYANSKLTGEYFVRSILKKHFVIRICGLFGHVGSSSKGGNFVELMLSLAKEGREIKVVNDQVLTPTSTKELAKKFCQLIQTNKYGLYHITNNGACSWYEFAKEIFNVEGLNPKLSGVTSEAYGARAKRPRYSVLDHCNLRKLGLDDMMDWNDALKTYLLERRKGK